MENSKRAKVFPVKYPKRAAITLAVATCSKRTYAKIVTTKKNINLQELRNSDLRVRISMIGALTLGIPGEEDTTKAITLLSVFESYSKPRKRSRTPIQ